MTEDEKAELHGYEKQAQARVGDATEWLVESPTVKGMAEAIRNTEFGKIRGQGDEDGRYVLISYQPKIAAEPTSMPHLRIPPLRNSPSLPGGQRYKKMIQAVIQSRQPADSGECGVALHHGDCFVVGDAERHGNTTALMSVFCTDEGAHLQKVTKTLYCHYSEENLHRRRDTVRGNLSMEQTEHFHYVTANGLATNKRQRLHVPKSTTAGTSIGPMPLPDWKNTDETWALTFKDKKTLYGDARILPSGRPEGDGDLVGSGEKRVSHVRKDADVEPVTYNGLHRELLEELVHQVGSKGKLKGIIDLTPTDPTLAMMAIEWQVPYLGIVFNDFHLEAMKRQLVKQVFKKFLDPKVPVLHVPKLLALMQKTSTSGSGAADDPKVPAPPKSTDEAASKKKKGREGDGLRAALLSQLGAGPRQGQKRAAEEETVDDDDE